jgi:hypothetical protein
MRRALRGAPDTDVSSMKRRQSGGVVLWPVLIACSYGLVYD